jgi:hypothetical protein
MNILSKIISLFNKTKPIEEHFFIKIYDIVVVKDKFKGQVVDIIKINDIKYFTVKFSDITFNYQFYEVDLWDKNVEKQRKREIILSQILDEPI